MPDITIESGALSDEQKEELVRRLTEVYSEIMNVPRKFFVSKEFKHSPLCKGCGGAAKYAIPTELLPSFALQNSQILLKLTGGLLLQRDK